MQFQRQSGVFLHPTSLPGPHGIGDLGSGARSFIDFLSRAEQSLWQFCPLGPTTAVHHNSPYQSPSAFAGNPLLIDLMELRDRGYLGDDEVDPPDWTSPHETQYERVAEFKFTRLRSAYRRFEDEGCAEDAEKKAFEAFIERESGWLTDYALFMAIKSKFDDSWTEWPPGIRDRKADSMQHYREEMVDEIRYRMFLQWVFDEQWQALAEYAHDSDVSLVGDIPIYVAADSADVWANPGLFALDDDNQPAAVAGVPPNPGDDGQRWGNPVYDWDRLQETGYRWWIDRFKRVFDLVDIARIDHFKAFEEFWAIPANASEPAAGEWRPGPGVDFFETVESALGQLPFFVEDLGFLDEGVAALRDRFDFPGMCVPHYADWCQEGHRYQPMHFPEQSIGYTSTHDTDTIVGYYETLSDQQRNCLHYNLGTDGEEIEWDIIEAVWNSESIVAMTTMQDVLGLGSEARFNTPGTATGNWRWRVTEDGLSPAVADRLWELTDIAIR